MRVVILHFARRICWRLQCAISLPVGENRRMPLNAVYMSAGVIDGDAMLASMTNDLNEVSNARRTLSKMELIQEPR